MDVQETAARELAELQAKIAERVGTAERGDVKAYNAALAAGWSADELRKIGFPESEKKARVRRRQARPSAPTVAAPAAGATDDVGPEPEAAVA